MIETKLCPIPKLKKNYKQANNCSKAISWEKPLKTSIRNNYILKKIILNLVFNIWIFVRFQGAPLDLTER